MFNCGGRESIERDASLVGRPPRRRAVHRGLRPDDHVARPGVWVVKVLLDLRAMAARVRWRVGWAAERGAAVRACAGQGVAGEWLGNDWGVWGVAEEWLGSG